MPRFRTNVHLCSLFSIYISNNKADTADLCLSFTISQSTKIFKPDTDKDNNKDSSGERVGASYRWWVGQVSNIPST